MPEMSLSPVCGGGLEVLELANLQPFRRTWSGGAKHFHAPASVLSQAFAHRAKRQFGRVAVLAQMTQQCAAEAIAGNAGEHFGGRGIREMPVP